MTVAPALHLSKSGLIMVMVSSFCTQSKCHCYADLLNVLNFNTCLLTSFWCMIWLIALLLMSENTNSLLCFLQNFLGNRIHCNIEAFTSQSSQTFAHPHLHTRTHLVSCFTLSSSSAKLTTCIPYP